MKCAGGSGRRLPELRERSGGAADSAGGSGVDRLRANRILFRGFLPRPH